MTEILTSDNPWTANEQVTLARIARLIIGPDPEGVMPAADDEQIFARILIRAVDFERPIRKGMAAVEELPEDEEALNQLLDSHSELRSMLRAMMQVVAQCYYQDPRVLEALGFEARPPFPAGHELEEGDWDLLEPVKSRQPLFRV